VTGADGYVVGPDQGKLLLARGIYRITCDTDAYFAALGAEAFYGEIVLTFTVSAPAEFAEQTLAVAPYGYVSFTARKVAE
jgi:5-hydroxyisourate hydrolase